VRPRGWIEGDSSAQQSIGFLETRPRVEVDGRERTQIEIVGIKTLGGLALRPFDLGEPQAWFDRGDDPRRNAILQLEDFRQVPLPLVFAE
jgi:hypothetical protein